MRRFAAAGAHGALGAALTGGALKHHRNDNLDLGVCPAQGGCSLRLMPEQRLQHSDARQHLIAAVTRKGDGFGIVGRSESSYKFLCCKLGFCLGSEVVRRHDAAHPLATDTLANPHVRNNGRAPVPGLRRYVTIENFDTFAMMRLGGQTLARYGAMPTVCCVDHTGRAGRYGLAHLSISASSSSAISTYSSTIRS
jgi:hypothetical protein